MSNANINCRSLTRSKKKDGGHKRVTQDTQTKMIVILRTKNKMK